MQLEKLSAPQVAKLINHYGQTKQISKALRVFYQYERTSSSSTALISAFICQDLLSAWKLYCQFDPDANTELSCLAKAHYKKHPDYLRDNLLYSGFSQIDRPLKKILESSNMSKDYLTTIDLWKQVGRFEEAKECSKMVIKAFAELKDVEMTTKLYKSVKCHESMLKVLPELEVIDFFSSIPSLEKNANLYSAVLERVKSGDARVAIEREMNYVRMNVE